MNAMHTLFRLLAAWVCLAVQVAVASPFPTLATAGVAALDGEHDVVLDVGSDRLRVVLGHRSAPRVVSHDHCGPCRLLVSISQSASQGDHVVEFSSMTPDLRHVSRAPVAHLNLAPVPPEMASIQLLELPRAERHSLSVSPVDAPTPIPAVALVATDASLRI